LDNSVITKESRRQAGRLKRQTGKDMFGAQEKGVTLDVMPLENRRHSGRLKRQTAEVTVALHGDEMDGDKVLVKEDGGKPMGVDGRSVEQTGSMVGDARENEKLLKSVRLQQRILRIKEVQMSRVRGKRLAKGV
jgi:hypothetical protein